MAYQYIKKAILAGTGSGVESFEHTGSFVKLQAIGAYDANSTLERIEFGELTNPETNFTASGIISHSITVPNGHCIDGPIARFKVKDTGGTANLFFAYVKY